MATAVLGTAYNDPGRISRGGIDRADQCDWQPGRVHRSERRRPIVVARFQLHDGDSGPFGLQSSGCFPDIQCAREAGRTGGARAVKTLPPVDVVIAGGGWTGLLVAKELGARTSLSVAVLERGAPRKTSDYSDDM